MKVKTTMYLIKRKGKAQKADIHRIQKRHMPPVSLLLWHEMVAVCCFVGLQRCDCGLTDENRGFDIQSLTV